MSHGYRAIQWSPFKRRYDLVLVAAILSYIVIFMLIAKMHAIGDEIAFIRATATCAFAMLTLTLCIGPLARIDRRLLPLLYNRRHLGVATFLVAGAHALVVTGFYHGFGVISPPLSLLVSNTQYGSITAFPFEILGVLALLILFLMASTSHDFWLKNLSPSVWKGLHMMVYVAWVLLIFHIALGVLQTERNPIYVILFGVAVLTVPGLHLFAGLREVKFDQSTSTGEWIEVGAADEIPDARAKIVCVKNRERVAIFRHGEKLSAVGNVCAHQGGPIGEGRIIDGCITCPWHGYQYRPEDGCSPPPFTEKIPTYPVRVENGRVFVCMEENHVGG